LKQRNALEAENPKYVHGLTTANVGSIYDVNDASTKASEYDGHSSINPIGDQRKFERTEKAT